MKEVEPAESFILGLVDESSDKTRTVYASNWPLDGYNH